MKNNKVLLSTIVFLVFVVLVLATAQYFLFQEIKNKIEAASSLENIVATQSDTIEYINSTKQNLLDIEGDRKKIANYIIPSDGEVALLGDLEDLAKFNNLLVSVESLSLENKENLKNMGLTNLVVQIKTQGKWSSIYKFLSQIESLPLEVTVEKVYLINKGNSLNGPFGENVWEGIFDIKVLKYL